MQVCNLKSAVMLFISYLSANNFGNNLKNNIGTYVFLAQINTYYGTRIKDHRPCIRGKTNKYLKDKVCGMKQRAQSLFPRLLLII